LDKLAGLVHNAVLSRRRRAKARSASGIDGRKRSSIQHIGSR